MAKTSKKTSAKRLRDANLRAASAHCATVRERIVKLRKAQDLTGGEIARMMGISRPFYTQLERGTRRMDLVYFLIICRALQAEPAELIK